MENIKHVNSVVDRDFRNRINQLIDIVNGLGDSIDELVVSGAMTTEQYSQLLTAINGLVKKGEVNKDTLSTELKNEIEKINNKIDKGSISVTDINKNLGKLDQTYLTDQLLQQIAGNAPVNAVPADNSITSEKIVFDSLSMNRGKVYPLKLHQLGSGDLRISDLHKEAILDAKVFGANPDKVYRLAHVSNGFVRPEGFATWGITVTEHNMDGSGSRIVTNYIDHPGKKGSDGIDTIIQGNDEMMFSVTVDRRVISDSNIPTHMNLSTSPNTIIDPSKYSF